jgi:hypothetical protein
VFCWLLFASRWLASWMMEALMSFHQIGIEVSAPELAEAQSREIHKVNWPKTVNFSGASPHGGTVPATPAGADGSRHVIPPCSPRYGEPGCSRGTPGGSTLFT